MIAVGDSREIVPARRLLVRELRSLDLACSRFRDDSELVTLNAAGGVPVRASPMLRAMIRTAVAVAESTGGLVDPTVGRSLRLAGYDRTIVRLKLLDGRLGRPAFEPAGRWRELEIDDRNGTVRVPAGIELDLGAVAKAFAADRIAREVADSQGTGALVSIGGDVAVAGAPPDGGWVIGIDDDHATPAVDVTTRVAVSMGGLASSGTRVRRWRAGSLELHHILDPRTGRPAAEVWTTVSVAACSCVEANAASTAAIVLGQEAPRWLSERRLPARLARADGSAVTVAGWPEERAA